MSLLIPLEYLNWLLRDPIEFTLFAAVSVLVLWAVLPRTPGRNRFLP